MWAIIDLKDHFNSIYQSNQINLVEIPSEYLARDQNTLFELTKIVYQEQESVIYQMFFEQDIGISLSDFQKLNKDEVYEYKVHL